MSAPHEEPISDTPVTPDTPTPQEGDLDAVERDLMTPTTGHPAPADTPEGQEGTPPVPEDGLPDPSTILMRDDYLRSKNLVVQMQRDLEEKQRLIAEREAELYRQTLALQNGTQRQEQPQEAPTPTVDLLDPEVFEMEDSHAIAKAVRALQEENRKMREMLDEQRSVHVRATEAQVRHAEGQLLKMIQSAEQGISQRYGVVPTPQEIATSLKTHAQVLAQRNGGFLPEDAAMRAWVMDHADAVLSAPAKPTNGQTPAPAPPPKSTTPTGGIKTNEDKILADLLSQGQG